MERLLAWLVGLLDWLQRAWAFVEEEMRALRGAPFVAMLLALCAVLLLGLEQGSDLSVTAASKAWQAVALLVASLFYGLECWFWTRLIVERRASKAFVNSTGWSPTFLHTWAPRVLGAAPFAIAALAIWKTKINVVLALILGAAAVVMFFGLWLRRRAVEAAGRTPDRHDTRSSLWFRYASLAVAAIAFVLFTAAPVGPSQAIGAISVVYVGLGCITAVMAALLNWGRVARLPMLGALIVVAAVFSLWVDNHQVAGRAFAKAQIYPLPAGKPDIKTEFDAWCHLQAGCEGGAPTPIVFVSAEGGASRAGYWAADVLGALEYGPDGKSTDRFSHHVFAISSVSGGSVGAAAYVSTISDQPRIEPAKFQFAVADASAGDYLSPAVAGLLFPDLVQRVLPLAFLPDRAETLERGFETGWTQHCKASACGNGDLWRTSPFLSLWSKSHPADLWIPVLLINGAREEDGRRVITSNVQIDSNDFPESIDFHGLTGADVATSTAISNGARFPLVSPGGTLADRAPATNRTKGPYGHILDGGYFDASGSTTLGELARAVLQIAAAEHRQLRVVFIELSNDSDLGEDNIVFARGFFDAGLQARLCKSSTSRFLSDFLGPLDGLNAARGGHGVAASEGLSLSAETGQRPPPPSLPGCLAPQQTQAAAPRIAAPADNGYYLIHLCHNPDVIVPMDWALSDKARAWADKTLTTPFGTCDNPAKLRQILADVTTAPAPAQPAP